MTEPSQEQSGVIAVSVHGGKYSTESEDQFTFEVVFYYRAARNADVVYQWEFCLSVRLLNACIVTKRKKDLSRFLYHMKDHLA